MIPAHSSAVSAPSTAPGKSVKRLLPWLVAVAFFMESLDTTILNTAVPAIAKALAVAPLRGASTIASTMQQMSISFGVAAASPATALFIPDRFQSSAPEMIHGIHQAFLVLGGLTVLSGIVFRQLKDDDGDVVSQHKVVQHAG